MHEPKRSEQQPRYRSVKLVVSALVVVLMCISCERQAPATLKPSASPSAVATESPMYAAPNFYLPRPVTTVVPELPSPSGPLGFSCRLPIYVVDSHTPPQSQVGFLSVPAGSVTLQPAPALPAGSIVTVSNTPEPLHPSAFYFDRADSRWVPVAGTAVSPDGSHYAYMTFPEQNRGLMNIVDVATGKVRAFPATYTYPIARYLVADYAKEGIYLGIGYEGYPSGVWLMNPNTGAVRQVAGLPYLQAVAGTVAWLGTTNSADPNPAPGGLSVAPDSVDRFDLSTGNQTPWLYLPGTVDQVVAVDAAGHPIVLVGHGFSDNAELLLLTSPGAAEQIFHGTYRELLSLSSPMADSHGVWFGSPAGIYLYSPTIGMRKISDQAAYPGNGCV